LAYPSIRKTEAISSSETLVDINRLHGAVYQRIDLLIITAVRISNPTLLLFPEDKILQNYGHENLKITNGYFMFSIVVRWFVNW
jgi:hypothetical protein